MYYQSTKAIEAAVCPDEGNTSLAALCISGPVGGEASLWKDQ